MALRSRLAPLIFLMRLSSLRSMGPNLAKSTLGQGIRPSPAPSPPPVAGLFCAAAARVCTAPLITERVKPCTSASVMRPLSPLPLTSFRGTPNSRANLRTEGDACGRPTGAAPGACAGTAKAGAGAAAAGAEAAGAAATGAATATAGAATGAAAAPPATPSRITTRSPMFTVSPSLTLISLTTPAVLDGISIDALSDSTVTRLCSTLTVSPTLTSSSMTVTSLKSPMSGIRTSTGPLVDAATGAATGAGVGAGATEAVAGCAATTGATA